MATIQKRNNSYTIKVSCGYNTQGKQIIQSMTWKPEPGMTEKQITKELNRQAVMFEEECCKGFQHKAVKFEVFCEQWFDEYAKPNLRNTTYERMGTLRTRVYAAIGHLRMDKINPRQIQTFVTSLSKEGANARTCKPLAVKTIRHYLSFISDVFSYGVNMGVVDTNPCSKVRVPKAEVKEKEIYSPEEIRTILDLLEDEPEHYKVFFNLAIYSGFRRGELLGLEWKDVDWKNNVISVRRTSCYTPSRGMYTDTTKTKRSQRTIKFPAVIMEMLRVYKANQERKSVDFGDHWVDSDRIFIKATGEPMFIAQPFTWFKRFCERHNIPFHGVHCFRHTFASLLVNQGVDIVTVSGAMGHSTVSTTSNIYCHMLDEAQAKVSEAVSNALNISFRRDQTAQAV